VGRDPFGVGVPGAELGHDGDGEAGDGLEGPLDRSVELRG